MGHNYYFDKESRKKITQLFKIYKIKNNFQNRNFIRHNLKHKAYFLMYVYSLLTENTHSHAKNALNICRPKKGDFQHLA